MNTAGQAGTAPSTFDAAPTGAPAPPQAAADQPRLSATEAAILELLAAGESNRRICNRLYLAQPTVDYHLARLRHKLGAASRVAIVSRAYAFGLLGPGEWPPRVRQPDAPPVPARPGVPA